MNKGGDLFPDERWYSKSVILVSGAFSNVGRHIVSQLPRTGAAVHALTRNSADLPGEVVRGDLSAPDALETCLDRVEPVSLVWPFFTAQAAPAVLDAVTKHARRSVYLTSEGVGADLEQQTDTISA